MDSGFAFIFINRLSPVSPDFWRSLVPGSALFI
jgi:hypothetical protein